MDKELIQQLVSWVQSTSPIVWQMAVNQVHTQMIQNVYGAVTGLIFASIFLWAGIHCWHKADEKEASHDDISAYATASIMSLIVSGIAMGMVLIFTIPYLIQVWTNPDYAALQTIVDLAGRIKK